MSDFQRRRYLEIMRNLYTHGVRLIKISLIFTFILVTFYPTNLNAISPEVSKSKSYYLNHLHPHKSPITNIQNKPAASKNRSLLGNLQADFWYVLGERDFYEIFGGLSLSPSLFKANFDSESLEINRFLEKSEFADDFFELGEVGGSTLFHLPVSLIIYYIGGKGPESKIKAFGSDLFSSHIINSFATVSMKRIINRNRPNGSRFSYPSGHTSTAFTSAGVIYNHFGLKLGIPAFIGAAYIGFSRLQENVHYMSDVAAGAALGTYIAFKVTHREDKKHKFNFMPFTIKDSPGVKISYWF